MAQLLPRTVACCELRGDLPDSVLHPSEAEVIAGAVERRRREFATVRGCARWALAALGHPPVPLLPGPAGAPRWPAGTTGSMTHCDGYRAAAVARARETASIGIDAEPAHPLPPDVVDMVVLPAEQAALAALRHVDPATPWDRLLFSCKEAVYKAWYPLTRSWLGFDQVAVIVDPQARRFTARLLGPAIRLGDRRLTVLRGRYAVARSLVLAAVTVPAPGVGTAARLSPGAPSTGGPAC